jgi:RNA polymerase sigma factor (sigma-70 family)
MSSQNLKLPEPRNTEQFTEMLLPNISAALRCAYVKYRHPIRRDELDDLTQQIYLLLIEDNNRRLDSFKHQASFETWLQTVVNRHFSNYLQRRKGTEALDKSASELLSYPPSQDDEVDTFEKHELLLKALDRLSEQELFLYRLYFIYELKASKIAVICEIEVKEVYKRKQTLVLKLSRLVRDLQRH